MHSYWATSLINSSLLTLLCSTPAMFTKNNWLLQTNIRALLLRSSESWVGIQDIMGYVFIADLPYDRTIAIDHRRSQTITEDRTWLYLLWLQTIVEVRFHTIADNHRTFCNLRWSAIIWKPVFILVLFPYFKFIDLAAGQKRTQQFFPQHWLVLSSTT